MKPKNKKSNTFFGEYLYNLVIPEDHFFRLVLMTIDWKSIRKELMKGTEGRQVVYADTGRPAYDPLIIFKMFFLQKYHNLSDAKVEERARTDLTYRFFLQVPIPGPVPDESTLSLYRTKWGDKKIEQVFNNIFKQIQSFGYADVKAGCVGDITHQRARIQKHSARVLIYNCFKKWLKEIQALGVKFPAVFDTKQLIAICFTTEGWFLEYQEKLHQKEVSRKQRLALLVQKILLVQQKVSEVINEPVPFEVSSSDEWLVYSQRKTTLNQILAENVTIDGNGIKQKKGERKIISEVDPEARSGYKSKKKAFTGYKVSVSMTEDNFHSSVETLPGNESDKNQAVPLVEKIIANTQETPSVLALDLGYNSVKNRQVLHALGVQPGIEQGQPPNPRNPTLFSTGDFQFDGDNFRVTCPGGFTTYKYTPNQKNETFLFRFAKSVCDNCPLKARCTTSKTGRTVQFSQHYRLLAHDRQFLDTPAYELLRRARWRLEGRFGEGKRSHSLAETPYHGLNRSHLHNLLIFIVLNVKRFIRLQYFPQLKLPTTSGHSGASG